MTCKPYNGVAPPKGATPKKFVGAQFLSLLGTHLGTKGERELHD